MARRYLLGFDVGSSSVKASLTDVDNGEIAASAFFPEHEAPIMAVKLDGQNRIQTCGGKMQNSHFRKSWLKRAPKAKIF